MLYLRFLKRFKSLQLPSLLVISNSTFIEVLPSFMDSYLPVHCIILSFKGN